MPSRPFIFEIYRLNIVDEEPTLFTINSAHYLRTNHDIISVLRAAADSQFDLTNEIRRNTFTWSLREYAEYELERPKEQIAVVGLTLARSVVARAGRTVTESSIEDALSEFSPPTADEVHLLFNLSRHLVAVEYNSIVMSTQLWRASLQTILQRAARSLEFDSEIRIEPVPREEEVLNTFRSFSRLTRLRVRLRIPNPELDRRTERLRRQMLEGNIRDYTQDMRNPKGLSKEETALPYATAAMAQAGYKDGEVILSGYRDGRLTTVKTGKRAARGRVEELKDFLRGIAANAKSKETRAVVGAIMDEVDRIAEAPALPEAEQ